MRVTTFALDAATSTPGAGSRRGALVLSQPQRVPLPGTRDGRFPCQPRMDPRSAALRHNKVASPRAGAVSSTNPKRRDLRTLAQRHRPGTLTDPPPPASTADSRWPSWPCSLRSERRRSRYLPSSPRLERVQPSPLRRRPRGPIRSALPVATPAFTAGRSLKRARARQNSRPAPDAAPRSRPPLSTRFTQQAVVLASMRLPVCPRS